MESIVNDNTDSASDTPADDPVGEVAASEVDSGTADQVVEPVDSSTDDTDGDTSAEPDVITAEQARKLRSEASNLRHRLRQTESELEQLRTQVAERDERLAAAENGRLDALIYSRAAGKLANPADAVVFLDRADLNADDVASIDAAIEALLEERSYLRAGQTIPQIDQGVQRERPRGKTFSDVMAEGLGWTNR